MSGGGLTYPLSYEEFRTKKTIALSTKIGEFETYVIFWGNERVGSIGYFQREENSPLEIAYWLGVKYWGNGIASKALTQALMKMKKSGVKGELVATVIKDNQISMHILKKCGFNELEEITFVSPARKMEVQAVSYSILLK